MSAQSDLNVLFMQQTPQTKLKPWLIGHQPRHIRRCSLTPDQQLSYAVDGATKFGAYYNEKLFFCQSLIAGVILSHEFTKIYIITPSQYGKSWLLGRLALLLAYFNEPTYIAGATTDTTGIIMHHTVMATQDVAPEVKKELLMKRSQLEKLSTSLSKSKIGFSGGGFVEPITLGDTYEDNIAGNKAVGRAGNYIVDEAALVSDKALAELGRREFANVDKSAYRLIEISNPHNPGDFYNNIVNDKLNDDTFVLWIDALTAVEEDRFSKEQVFNSDFYKHSSTCRRYLLCELDDGSSSMFEKPKVDESNIDEASTQYFLGIDSAYKGKDNIELALMSLNENAQMRIEEITEIKTPSEWIDGVTSEDIINQIARVAHNFHVSCIAVDVGYGVWLVEGLASKGLFVKGVHFNQKPTPARVRAGHYASVNASNKRAEMHLDFQDLVESQKLTMRQEACDQIIDALPYVVAKRKSTGKVEINPKSEIKTKIGHSPDAFDAVLLAVHAFMLFIGDEILS